MVAKVNSGKTIRGILNYNENKVRAGSARCLHENMFGSDVSLLSFKDKLRGFQNLIQRNRRATTNAVHISLNFHPDDKLSTEKLITIATVYMDKIGFGNQPYLIYQHTDAAHPHLHLVTTNIQANGKRIVLFNIGRNQSEQARQQIEKDFDLVVAKGRRLSPATQTIKPVAYGKAETKRTLAHIVQYVTRTYRYTSLPELNAVLGQYHIAADPGSEQSRMRTRGGLVYHLLDTNGKKAGMPIKASALYSKPTLKYLQQQFVLNAVLRQPHKERIKHCIDVAWSQHTNLTRNAWVSALQKENIAVVFRENDAGRTYGVTFIDHKTKVVYNGSDIGKAYSANAIVKRLIPESFAIKNLPVAPRSFGEGPEVRPLEVRLPHIIADLTHAESFEHPSPPAALHLRRKKKRKRKIPKP